MTQQQTTEARANTPDAVMIYDDQPTIVDLWRDGEYLDTLDLDPEKDFDEFLAAHGVRIDDETAERVNTELGMATTWRVEPIEAPLSES